MTPTRVTDGESTSFDFTGSAVTFSLVVDFTSPAVTIDTEVADSNGFTASTTPTFDVTSDESWNLDYLVALVPSRVKILFQPVLRQRLP